MQTYLINKQTNKHKHIDIVHNFINSGFNSEGCMQISALPFSFNLYLGRNSYVIQKFRCEAEKEHSRTFSTVCNKIYQRTYELGKTWGLKSSLSSFLPIFPLTRGTILSIQLLLFLRDKLSLNTI